MEENLEKETKKVLVVDDEQAIIDVLVYNLQKEGYETLEATDGVTAVNIALEQKPDLMLLDIMLPKMDGLTVCKRVKNYLNIPILMLTAKDAEIDKIVGLELGADDYITKPFSVRELMARVKANLRKNEISTIIKETEQDILKRVNYKVLPIYQPKNIYKVELSTTLSIKISHLIQIAYMLKKVNKEYRKDKENKYKNIDNVKKRDVQTV